jgi:predicted naringenin-chalcone synthase
MSFGEESKTASILALATAVPPYAFDQEEIAEKMIDLFNLDPHKAENLKQLYKNSAIHTRYSVIPDLKKERQDWNFWGSNYPKTIPTTSKRNALYKVEASKLAYEAASKVLKAWGGNSEEISHVISVSCTGLVAPGIEFDLTQLLNLKASTQRLGINFMGCFGAFKGLSVAQAFAKENPKHRILLVCTELCSLHLQAEQTLDNLVAHSLFSDGAAAVIVGAEPQSSETPLWQIQKTGSIAIDHTKDKMSWEVGDHGFNMKLSRTVPVFLGRHITPFVNSLVSADFSYENCDWAIHPGGKSIIQAIEKALKLQETQTKASWDTLANYGNMSSATFLFVLHQLLEQKSLKKWTVGLGFGPGLSVEGLLLSI